MVAQDKERYAEDVVEILIGHGYVDEDEKEQFRRYIGGW